MTNRDKFCAGAQEQEDIGSIYVLGSQGQTGGQITEPWIRKREHNKASNIKRVLALWKKRLAAGFTKLRAFDCSGFVLWLLAQLGLYDGPDKTANGIYYDLCNPISKGELLPGDLTFKKYLTNSRMYHVGIYRGGNMVTHCKGRSDGVITEGINKDGWNRYGRLKCLKNETASPVKPKLGRLLKLEYKAKAATPMRVKAGADQNTVTTIPKGASVTYMGKLGDWLRVSYNGETGYVLAKLFTRGAYMRGDDVKAVQKALRAAGFDPGDIDGVYGQQTVAAVVTFQTAKGLEVDGVDGPITWAALGL